MAFSKKILETIIVHSFLLVHCIQLGAATQIRVIAHQIGNAAMNIDYYFHTLGVACENQNPVLWRTINQDRNKCINSRSGRSSYYEGLSKGSFERMCRNWRQNEVCNQNFAKDLDHCLGKFQGSDAWEFTDAYADFTCRDLRDTETQLTLYTAGNEVSPGVFKCFADPILNCVSKDTFSNTQCSQFYTVQECYAKFYSKSNHKICNDLGVSGYLRDLFRFMNKRLQCSGPDAWENAIIREREFRPKPELRQNPVSSLIPKSGIAKPTYPSSLLRYEDDLKYNKPLPAPQIPLNIWNPVPFLLPVQKTEQEQLESPLKSWIDQQNWQIPVTRDFKGNIPASWAWGYERYGNPGNERFYTYRVEPTIYNDNVDQRGPVYDIYKIHDDNQRYGVPRPKSRSRGLSNRTMIETRGNNYSKRKGKFAQQTTIENNNMWEENPLRSVTNDHKFQILTTPSIVPFETRFIVPLSSSTAYKRTPVDQSNETIFSPEIETRPKWKPKLRQNNQPYYVVVSTTSRNPQQSVSNDISTSRNYPNVKVFKVSPKPKPTPVPMQKFLLESEERETFFQSTTKRPLKRIRVRKRKPISSTTTTETNTNY